MFVASIPRNLLFLVNSPFFVAFSPSKSPHVMGGLPLEIPWPPGPQAPRRRGGALSLGAAGGHGQRPDLGGAAGGAGARFTAGER